MSLPCQGRRLPDGRLQVPMRAEAADGTIGDGVVTLAPGDPGFDAWDCWLAGQRGPVAGQSGPETGRS